MVFAINSESFDGGSILLADGFQRLLLFALFIEVARVHPFEGCFLVLGPIIVQHREDMQIDVAAI